MSEPTETSPHILVVDDDRRIRSLLQKFLSDQGYRASSAASSNEARGKLSLEIFDLIVLDVMMPGETGLELTSVLRKEANYVPILMLTALAEVDNRIEGLRIGADGRKFENINRRRVRFRHIKVENRMTDIAAELDHAATCRYQMSNQSAGR